MERSRSLRGRSPATKTLSISPALATRTRVRFKREMTFWGNVSLGFTYLSPVVAVYSLFAASLSVAGPPMFWSLVIVGVGQFFVASVFGEVVAAYPVAGGVYPWSRRLWGRKWGWMNGWVYLVALLTSIGSIAYGAGPFLSALLGMENTVDSVIVAGLVVIALATALNLGGTKVLNTVAMLGLLAELGGALVVGGWLLVTARHHDLSVLFQAFGAGEGTNYFVAFAAAGLIGIFQYYGFEACGDVAEEVPNPGRTIPKAMRMTIYIGGFAAMFVCLSLILAVPDFSAVISGQDTDPVGNVLLSAFGPIGFKVVLARRYGLVPLVRVEPSGSYVPPCLLDGPRRHAPGEQAPEHLQRIAARTPVRPAPGRCGAGPYRHRIESFQRRPDGHHFLCSHGHVHGLPDGGPGLASGAHSGMEAERSVPAWRLGHPGQHRSPGYGECLAWSTWPGPGHRKMAGSPTMSS